MSDSSTANSKGEKRIGHTVGTHDVDTLMLCIAGAWLFGTPTPPVVHVAWADYARMMAERDAAVHARAWEPIETAPRDGRLILVYAPGLQDLAAITCPCAWHPDAGFCVDEMRVPTHWMPLPAPPLPAPGGGA